MNAFRCLIAILGVIGSVAHEDCVLGADLSEQDVKEIRRIEKSLEDGSLPMPPGWTFNHGATDSGRKELEKVNHAIPGDDFETVVRNAGGWAKYKEGIASLLKSKDLVVRGFAAMLLADLGDKAYTNDLLALLQAPPIAGDNDVFFPDWDRGCAAQALGIIGDRDHINDVAKDFAALLGNKDMRDDAMTALGILNQTKYADKIAPFLHAEARSDRQAAAWSLITMESKQYAAAAIDVYSAFEQEQEGIPGNIPVSAKRSLKKRFQESLSRLKKNR